MTVFQSYSVKILNKAFILGGVVKSDKTARVFMNDALGLKTEIRNYAYIEVDDLYAKLSDVKPIDLNNFYVKNFSLNDYRKKNKIDENAYIEIPELSAVNAFFDADESIDFSYAQFNGDSLHFINATFCCHNLSFIHSKFIGGDEDFTQAFFLCDSVNFQYADFNEGNVLFENVTFQCKSVSFVNCNFRGGNKNFKSADFRNADLTFQFAKFGDGDVDFEKAFFYGKKIDFSKTEFGKSRLDFRLAEFGDGDISFDECEMIEGKMRFRRTKFGNGKISVEYCELGNTEFTFDKVEFGTGLISFYQSDIASVNFQSSQLNNYIDLRLSSCNLINLRNSVLRNILDLNNTEGNVNIKVVNFGGIRMLGRLFIDWFDNDVKGLIYRQEDTSVKMKAEQFRMIKEEFRSIGKYTDEDMAYLEFKRLELLERKNRVLSRNKLNAIWFYPLYFIEWVIFDQIGHYATNPLRVLVSMLFAYLSFSICYIILITSTNANIISLMGDDSQLSVISKSLYFSAVTYLTIGYGDFVPTGIIRGIAPFEGFVGLFLMAYFTVAFVRKILR